MLQAGEADDMGQGVMQADMFHLILQAQAEYARTIDNDRMEDWPSFFTDECLYKVTTANNHALGYEAGVMFANSKGMLKDRISALREANIYEKQSYRHINGVPCILEQDGEITRCETSFFVIRIMRDGKTDVFASGRYLDAFVNTDDGVKLKERIVVCDSSRIDTLLALPL